MRLETAREVVLVWRSTPVKASQEIAPTRKTQFSENNRDNKKRKNGDCRRSPDAHQKKAKSPDQSFIRSPPRKYNNFSDLTRSREDVFLAI